MTPTQPLTRSTYLVKTTERPMSKDKPRRIHAVAYGEAIDMPYHGNLSEESNHINAARMLIEERVVASPEEKKQAMAATARAWPLTDPRKRLVQLTPVEPAP